MANYRRRRLGKENQEQEGPLRAFAIETEENPKLNARQEAYVFAILSGKSKLEAFREAGYSTRSNNNVQQVKACELAKKPKIQAALRLGMKAAMDRRPVTIEQHLADLARLRELAVDSAQIAAGVQAETARGRAAGLYEERLRVTVGLSDEALISQLAALLSPEMANELAKSLLPNRKVAMIEGTVVEVVDEAVSGTVD